MTMRHMREQRQSSFRPYNPLFEGWFFTGGGEYSAAVCQTQFGQERQDRMLMGAEHNGCLRVADSMLSEAKRLTQVLRTSQSLEPLDD